MKVLVTGATGFLGSRLVSRLVQEGDGVRALVRKTSRIDQLLQQGVEIFYGDLKDRESLGPAVEGVDVVYHAGATMGGPWKEYEEGTVKGTQRMLELSLHAGVKRFVHISTIDVYQVYELGKNAVVREDCPYQISPEVVGSYTRAKVEAEKLAFDFFQKGLPVVVLRPGIIYGPGRKILSPHIGYSPKPGVFIVIGREESLLPIIQVDNTIDAILLAAAREEALGQAYNIVDDAVITKRDCLKRYKEITNSKLLTLRVPLSFLLLVVSLVELARRIGVMSPAPSPSRYGLISKHKSLRYDNSKAKKELGWHPKVSLEEGLRKAFERQMNI